MSLEDEDGTGFAVEFDDKSLEAAHEKLWFPEADWFIAYIDRLTAYYSRTYPREKMLIHVAWLRSRTLDRGFYSLIGRRVVFVGRIFHFTLFQSSFR